MATSALFLYLFSLLFFMSDALVEDWGLEPSIASFVLARRAAMFMLGITVLTFGARNLLPSSVRQIICLSIGVTLLGLSCMGTYEYINGNINASIIPPIIIETLLWVSYGIVVIADQKQKIANK